MMSVQTILQDLEKIAAAVAGDAQADLRTEPDAVGGNLIERGLDSLDFVDYLLAIEAKYGIRVTDEDIGEYELVSTANIAQYLHDRSSKPGTS